MAKQRKQKQKEAQLDPAAAAAAAKPSSEGSKNCAVVRHQKLCLAIDIEQQRIYGHTELHVIIPESGIVGLHAKGLHIERVIFQGLPTKFELSSQKHSSERQFQSTTSKYTGTEAADLAFCRYKVILENESYPELLIYTSEPLTGNGDGTLPSMPDLEGVAVSKEPMTSTGKQADEAQKPLDKLEEAKLVKVEYWVDLPSAGAFVMGNTLQTHNQLRRARCWFPCVDSMFCRCSYHLEFTVNSDYVAVSSGKLLYQVFSADNRRLKTFVYSLEVPTAASYISLVVGPLIVLPDRQNSMLLHMCMPGKSLQLQCSVSFFHSVFSFYEEYLGTSFPFGCYKQIFIDPNISSMVVGASMVIFSSHLLIDERIIDQAINTRIKLAYALAQQWFGMFITPDTSSDAWLLEGLSGFLTSLYIKRHFGNNEACYRHFRSNEAVTTVDVAGTPPLSPPTSLQIEAYGTENLGFWGKMRSWKAVAVLQMLEKQMGPEPFRKILQRIILKAQDPARQSRTLSTKEFRHFANKIGNLERPFLKDFFPRWVQSPGCPALRMGFSYNKRRSIVELAVYRGCTAESPMLEGDGEAEDDSRVVDVGWPGMMSIRLHELDGMYDHPSLPMAGDTYQLLELPCHTKLAGRRLQKLKKGNKLDAVDENAELALASMESPLLWLRADPGLEYLSRILLNQPERMWINQLEKDRDVVAQVQAITALNSLPHSFAVVNALHNCLLDSKVFCRVRIEAAAALASTASEATNWVGLTHLIKFYKSRHFDPEIGLPRSNDFHDLSEYFVLEAIPVSIAMVRSHDEKSPLEAVEFIDYILKHNDNSGNAFSDAYWLSSVIEAVGILEFGMQTLEHLSQMLKQIDRLLQYDRIIPSYNCILTISCIRTLTRLALKFLSILPPAPLERILSPFKDSTSTFWQVRVAALQALLDIRKHTQGLDASITLALHLVLEENHFIVQNKLMAHALRMCLLDFPASASIDSTTTDALLDFLDSEVADNNVLLRHYVFALLQVLGDRPASLLRLSKPEPQVTAVMPLDQVEALQPMKAEVKAKVSSLKVRIQRPPEPKGDPVRIRVVPFSATTLKDADSIAGTGGRKEEDQKIGVLKLRLKPSSSLCRVGSEDPNARNSESLESALKILALQKNEAFPVSVGVEHMDETVRVSSHSKKDTSSDTASQVLEMKDLGQSENEESLKASTVPSSHAHQSHGVQSVVVEDDFESMKMKSMEEVGGAAQMHSSLHGIEQHGVDQPPSGGSKDIVETEAKHTIQRIGSPHESERLPMHDREKEKKKHKDKKRKREREKHDHEHKESRVDKHGKNDTDFTVERLDKIEPYHQGKEHMEEREEDLPLQERQCDKYESIKPHAQLKLHDVSEKDDNNHQERRQGKHEKHGSHSRDKRHDRDDPSYREKKRLKKSTGHSGLGHEVKKSDHKDNHDSSEPSISYSDKKQPENTSEFIVRLKVKR